MLSLHLLPGWVNSRPSTRTRSHFSFLFLGATERGLMYAADGFKKPEIPSHEDYTSWRLLTWWIIHPSRPFFLFFVCRIPSKFLGTQLPHSSNFDFSQNSIKTTDNIPVRYPILFFFYNTHTHLTRSKSSLLLHVCGWVIIWTRLKARRNLWAGRPNKRVDGGRWITILY
jgi:hypothetical protein